MADVARAGIGLPVGSVMGCSVLLVATPPTSVG
jgi:hypothetical protein